MRKFLLGCTASAALLGAAAHAGGMPEPMMEPEVVEAATSSSSGGVIVPLLLLLVIAAAVAGSGGDEPQVSDRRLKTDVQWTGMAPNGLPLYRFRYRGSKAVFEGVMAQDVANLRPDALVRGEGGLMAVDYGRLGLQMKRVA